MAERTTPKQQRGIDTRTRIIEAANAVYERDGRDYFKTQTVQKDSGLSIGSIYRYFTNRVALLEAVLAYRVDQGLDEPLPTPEAAPEQSSAADDTVAAIKRWCQKVIVGGEGKHDLKTAGQFILMEIEKRGL